VRPLKLFIETDHFLATFTVNRVLWMPVATVIDVRFTHEGHPALGATVRLTIGTSGISPTANWLLHTALVINITIITNTKHGFYY